MKLYVDLNCDMGESFGAYTIGRDKEVIQHITSANIACGFHASDPSVMEKTIKLCKENGVQAGAHPGYPDLLGFGRRDMAVRTEELIDYIIYQVGALSGFLTYHNLHLQHVKMHGALYNYLVREDAIFFRIIAAVKKAFGNPVFLTLATDKGMKLKEQGAKKGYRIALEAFPDRQYSDAGELLLRSEKDALLKNPEVIAQRALRMVKEKGIESINGRWIEMAIDTLCLHGDDLASVEAASKIKSYCEKEGITLKPLGEFV
jgi:5-oxoprolinase (ATP-hydrolysing) subunit A